MTIQEVTIDAGAILLPESRSIPDAIVDGSAIELTYRLSSGRIGWSAAPRVSGMDGSSFIYRTCGDVLEVCCRGTCFLRLGAGQWRFVPIQEGGTEGGAA